jgi:hypothetical protein
VWHWGKAAKMHLAFLLSSVAGAVPNLSLQIFWHKHLRKSSCSLAYSHPILWLGLCQSQPGEYWVKLCFCPHRRLLLFSPHLGVEYFLFLVGGHSKIPVDGCNHGWYQTLCFKACSILTKHLSHCCFVGHKMSMHLFFLHNSQIETIFFLRFLSHFFLSFNWELPPCSKRAYFILSLWDYLYPVC